MAGEGGERAGKQVHEQSRTDSGDRTSLLVCTHPREEGTSRGHTDLMAGSNCRVQVAILWFLTEADNVVSPAGVLSPPGAADCGRAEQLFGKTISMCPLGCGGRFTEEARSPELSPTAESS